MSNNIFGPRNTSIPFTNSSNTNNNTDVNLNRTDQTTGSLPTATRIQSSEANPRAQYLQNFRSNPQAVNFEAQLTHGTTVPLGKREVKRTQNSVSKRPLGNPPTDDALVGNRKQKRKFEATTFHYNFTPGRSNEFIQSWTSVDQTNFSSSQKHSGARTKPPQRVQTNEQASTPTNEKAAIKNLVKDGQAEGFDLPADFSWGTEKQEREKTTREAPESAPVWESQPPPPTNVAPVSNTRGAPIAGLLDEGGVRDHSFPWSVAGANAEPPIENSLEDRFARLGDILPSDIMEKVTGLPPGGTKREIMATILDEIEHARNNPDVTQHAVRDIVAAFRDEGNWNLLTGG